MGRGEKEREKERETWERSRRTEGEGGEGVRGKRDDSTRPRATGKKEGRKGKRGEGMSWNSASIRDHRGSGRKRERGVVTAA